MDVDAWRTTPSAGEPLFPVLHFGGRGGTRMGVTVPHFAFVIAFAPPIPLPRNARNARTYARTRTVTYIFAHEDRVVERIYHRCQDRMYGMYPVSHSIGMLLRSM